MLRKRGFRKWFLIGWACVLAFGVGTEYQEAQALDMMCWRICVRMCRADDSSCMGHSGTACNCSFDCLNGHSSTSICV